jgi:hypothetical protein
LTGDVGTGTDTQREEGRTVEVRRGGRCGGAEEAEEEEEEEEKIKVNWRLKTMFKCRHKGRS